MKMFIALAMLVLSFNVTAHESKVKCTAKGFSGDSVTLAIENCTSVGSFLEKSCARQVSCVPYLSFCSAKGYAGDDVASAVARCTELGNQSIRTCLRSVSCR
ncbi:MAG: hypothetical protein CME70_17300 [Halobacteriovorax sp.]|nr:hypothetical protein [Halobacteriovorax sp.]|tara:strand:+ start:78751 stop:79056 length:306 start_codon:yes stop_codon:yes gene_type:complete